MVILEGCGSRTLLALGKRNLRRRNKGLQAKGVGPGMTLAWPGWKQSDIAVEVDTGRLETSRFKKCYANCVLLYFPSTEFKSAFNVY
jgi:hypothetical protein